MKVTQNADTIDRVNNVTRDITVIKAITTIMVIH